MPRAPAYTPEQLARIIALAPTCTDPVIAADVGFTPAKVLHIRTKLGISGFYRSRRPPEWIEAVRVRYVLDGEPAADVGASLGITATSVRRIAYEQGFKRKRELSLANIAASNRKYAASRPRPEPKPPKVLVSANDAELIADFLSRKAVTVLEPGTAAGLSALEREFYAARPPVTGNKALVERQRLARLRGSAARHHARNRTAAMAVAAE